MKKYPYILVVLVILVGMWASRTLASNTGALSPGTVADDATVGTVAWSNPNNAKVSDNVYVYNLQEPVGSASISHYLKATNFGFSIPAGATINGILVEIEKWSTEYEGTLRDSSVKIVKSDDSIGTMNKANADQWPQFPNVNTYISYGSSSDLWGESWTPTLINNSNFGIVLSSTATAGSSCESNVDHIRITVYYTTTSGQSGSQMMMTAF